MPARTAKWSPGRGSRELAVIVFELAVYDDIIYALRDLCWIGVCCAIDNRRGIEDRDVRVEAYLD